MDRHVLSFRSSSDCEAYLKVSTENYVYPLLLRSKRHPKLNDGPLNHDRRRRRIRRRRRCRRHRRWRIICSCCNCSAAAAAAAAPTRTHGCYRSRPATAYWTDASPAPRASTTMEGSNRGTGYEREEGGADRERGAGETDRRSVVRSAPYYHIPVALRR